MSNVSYTIGKLAEATGTKVETIRWYEKVGVLPAPLRSTSNYRAYSADNLIRLSFVRRARDLGFTLAQVRELLSLAERKDQSCEAISHIAREHLAEIDKKIVDLTTLRQELDSVIGRCHSGHIGDCRIVEALAFPRT